ncbi:MAG: peptide deformylase [Clostridia bacterium]|nr:peptide deformylase [Clostridia bacterium]
MAIRNLRYDNDEILRKRSREVEVVDDKIRELALDMLDTMHKYDGVGLAAPQVGILKRVIVIDLYEEGMQFVLINPVIVKTKGEQVCEEGCLSFPNQFAKVRRPKEIEVVALDLNGKQVRIKGKDLLAQALAHEIDHLEGQLFIDKIEPGTLETITPENNNDGKKKK